MTKAVTSTCPKHKNRFDCPDALIETVDPNTYGLIVHDGGSSIVEIHFCPFCGKNLDGPSEKG